MESEKNLSAHTVNLLQKIAIEATKEDESHFFVPLIPSLPINRNIFNDTSNLIDELKLDEVSQPNPYIWASQNEKSVSQIYQQFLNNPDFDNCDLSQIPKLKDEEVEIEIERFRKKIDPKKNKDIQSIMKFQKKMDEQINQNKAKILGNNLVDFEESKIKDKQNVDFENANELKEFCKNNDNGQNPFKFYNHFKYDSKNEKTDHLNEDEQKVAMKLKGYGLGKHTNSENLTISLENSFSDLIIEAEWCKINFQRQWVHNHIFSSKYFGVQGEEKFSWSNGTKFNQDETAKLPYLTVGAVVARNVTIQGIKSDSDVKQTLEDMEQNKKDSYALFFKLKNNSDDSSQSVQIFQDNDIKILLSAPRIIGFILKPFDAFPKYSRQTEWFSATLNGKEKKRNINIIEQEDAKILVRFLKNNSKYFKNFENLYQECLDEWKQNKKLDIIIDQGNENIDDSDPQILQVKVDTDNLSYTLGYGESLFSYDNSQGFNQKFSHNCINELISKENIDHNLKQKCKRLILHEIGRVIGFQREQIFDKDIEFNKEEVVNFYKKYLKQHNEIFNKQESEDQINKEAEKLAEEQVFIKNDVSNFENADKKSIMYIPYPQSWIAKPENYAPSYNYRLSESDRALFNSKFPLYDDSRIQEQIQQEAERQRKIQEEQLLLLQHQKENEMRQLIEEQQRKEKVEEFKRKKNAREEAERKQQEINERIEKERKEKLEAELQEKLIQEQQEALRKEKERQEEEERRKLEEQERQRLIIQQQLELQRIEEQRKKREEDEQRIKRIEDEERKQRIEDEERKQRKEQEESQRQQQLEDSIKFIEKYIKENQLIESQISLEEIKQCFEVETSFDKFENWEKKVEQVYDKLMNQDVIPCPKQIITRIELFEQKEALKNKLKNNQVNDIIPAPILKSVYLNLKLEVIQEYKKFYNEFKIMTNNISLILPQEEEICVEQFKLWLKDGNSINQKHLKELKEATLIHQEVLEELYQQKMKVFEDASIIISTFQKYMAHKMSEKQIAEMLFVEKESLKQLLINIFKFDQNDYFNVKNEMISKNICLSFLDNEIETFIFNVNNQKVQEGIQFLQKNYLTDPVLCMKILYYFSTSTDEEEKKEEENNGPQIMSKNTQDIIKNKKYQILKLYKNKNIARVVQKGFLISKQEDQDEAFKTQKKFEQRQLFVNESDNNKIKKFLNEYEQFNARNAESSRKLNDTNKIYEKQFEEYKLDVKLTDHEYIMTFKVEQKGYDYIMEYLKKSDRDENEKDLFTFQTIYSDEKKTQIKEQCDIEKIANILSTSIVIHNIDYIGEQYQVYGENFFNIAKPIHIVIDNKNEAFHLLQTFDLKIKIDSISPEKIQNNFPEIYRELLPWMKRFFGYKNLFKFIYDEKQQFHLAKNIQVLDDFAKEYQKYEADSSEENFKQMSRHCSILESLDSNLFNEWYAQIGQSGKFAEKYDFQRARLNTDKLVEKLKKIKEIFKDSPKLFDLQDFNRLSCRLDIDTLRKCLKEQKNNYDSFSCEIITQMFGFINRRESISTFKQVLTDLKLQVQISSRFLISMLLQQSDLCLRSRILHYQSEYSSVPLIMNCQSSYEGGNQKIRYVPEIAFSMTEGYGVLNFGAGNRAIMPLGKSQVINDLLFPSALFNHEAFEQQDKNLFSAGQVDVFFEKSFDKKRNFVTMDGQSSLKDQAFKSALILTNITIIHFQNKDFQDEDSLNDLTRKIKFIRSMNNNITIILLIRDAYDSKVLKPDSENNNKKTPISQHYPQAIDIEQDVDYCIELYNMGSMNKKEDRIQQIKILSKIFNELLKQMNLQKQTQNFTKQNFLRFIKEDETDKSYADAVIDIIKKTDDFIKEVEKIKENIFDVKSLPILDYKNQLRNKIVEIRQNKALTDIESQQKKEEELDDQLKDIQSKLRKSEPSDVLEHFKEIVMDPYNSIILQEVSKKLRALTSQNIEEPRKRRDLLIEQSKKPNDKQNESKDEIDARNSKFKMDLQKIDLEIYQKSISIEYFWRCLVFYLGKDTDFQKYNSDNVKLGVIQNIEKQLKNGDCFELIDGENLEFKGLFIQEVIKQQKTDTVIVVCVIGQQSTGKSTLMNFAFGTQFFTSAGRCTKGIYFTLQKIPDKFQVNQISWLLMLDTEGLQSPERIDDEYDRKIVLFAMLSADVLIINSKGEINANMVNTLKMCCVTYDALSKYGYTPEIIYTNGQNDRPDKEPFKNQVQNLKSQVIEASDSASIEKVAEQLLGYNDDKIQVFGNAFKEECILKDDEKGLKDDYKFKLGNTNFGVETARIYEIVQKTMNDKKRGFRQINLWLEQSKENWNIIDRFSANINQFSNLEEYRNDKKVERYLNEKWIEYLNVNSINEKDEAKIIQEKQRLIEIFQKYGQESLEQEMNRVELDNAKEKDIHLETKVFLHFDEWKQLPLQKGITVLSEKNHKGNIKAKMDVIQNEFRIKLRSKIKEEQMFIINQSGHRKVLNRAQQMANDASFKQITDPKLREQELSYQFNQSWQQSLDEIRGEAQINQMKKSYFDDLQRTFKIFNKFIEQKGENEFQDLLKRVENTYTKDGQQNVALMQDFLLGILTNVDTHEQSVRQFFDFSQEVLLQMKENPKERIFDDQCPENFLSLKCLLTCDYFYTFSKDLLQDLDKNLMKYEMIQNLTNMIQKQFKVPRYNFYGGVYYDKEMRWINDDIGQKSYLQLLIHDLMEAGFMINIIKRNTHSKDQQKTNLTCYDLDQVFNYFSYEENSLSIRDKKKKWIDEFVDNLFFSPKKFNKLENRIAFFFKSKVIQIKNQDSPIIPLEIHKQNNEDLKKALIISQPLIVFNPSDKGKKLQKISFSIMIQPRSSIQDTVTKWCHLSRIAFNQIDWKSIVVQIMQSVDTVLNQQLGSSTNTLQIIQQKSAVKEEKKEGTQEIDFGKIMELNQMDYNQVNNLEAEHLNTNLREKIDQELYSKLGLFLNPISKAKISWCALIYSWVKLYKKAETTFDLQLKELEDQKDRYWRDFQEIASGSSDLLTSQSAKQLMDVLEKKFNETIKSQASVEVANKLALIKNDFDNFNVYEFLDNKFLNPPQNSNYNEFLKYVHSPVEVFEKHANEMKKQKITDLIIVPQSEIVINQMQKCVITLLKILNKLNNHILKNNDKFQKNNSIENYFHLKNMENNQILMYQQSQLVSKFIYPVINYTMRRLLQGEFQMNEFEFQVFDEKNNGTFYLFQPKKLSEQGLLEIFTFQNLQNEIKDIINQDKGSNQLVEMLLKILDLNKYDNSFKMFQINKIIHEMQKKAEELQNKIQAKKSFDENWFGCIGIVKAMVDSAIGCKSQCQYCGRKCELQQHQIDTDHTCNKMGHQMRVFKGGCLINDKNEKYPSLRTCDMIKPDSKIYIDDIQHTWQSLLDQQAVKWKVNYKADDKDLQKKYEAFNNFWFFVGKQYCDALKIKYVEKNDEIDEQAQMHDSAVVVICIDMSGSMSGSRWNNAVKGAKQLIDYIRKHHLDQEIVRLVIILFDDQSKVVHDATIKNDIPERVWSPDYGGTDFGNPMRDAISFMQKYISKKDTAKIYFFTDGFASYPEEILDQIQVEIGNKKADWQQQGGKSKFECLLMCENTRNATMELMKKKFNSISQNLFGHDNCCKLMEAVDTSKLGSVMIENFKTK